MKLKYGIVAKTQSEYEKKKKELNHLSDFYDFSWIELNSSENYGGLYTEKLWTEVIKFWLENDESYEQN